MKPELEAKLWKIGTGLIAGLLVVSAVVSFFNDRRPDRCLIPQGYVGYLVIEHGVKGAPAIPVVGGHNLYKFPPSGRIKTSTPLATGFASDEYYYVTPHGLIQIPDSPGPGEDAGPGVMIWDAKSSYASSYAEGIPATEYAFVGTKSQYEAAERGPQPRSEEEEARDRAIFAKDEAGQTPKRPRSGSR